MFNNKDIMKKVFYLYVFLLPLLPSNIRYVGKLGDFILLIFMLLYIALIATNGQTRKNLIYGINDFFHDYLNIFMIFFALIMFVSISYASDKKLATEETLRFVSYIIIFFAIKYEFNDREFIIGVIKSYIFSVICVCVFGIIQFFTGIGLDKVFTGYSYASEKITSTMDNPNTLGAFAIMAFFPFMSLALYMKKKKEKIFYSIICLILLVNIVLTSSRNALIGLEAGMFCFIIFYSLKFLLPMILLNASLFFIPLVRSRAFDLLNSNQNESRVTLWKIAVKMIKDHPLFGVGNGNYISLYPAYVKKYPELAYYRYTKEPCHNSYLKVQSELGVFGSFAFAGILVSSFIKILKFSKNCKDVYYKYFYMGFLASMAAFFLMNAFDNLFFVPKLAAYFWIFIALAEGIFTTYKEAHYGI